MEDQCSPFSLGYWYQEEGMQELNLKQTLLLTTLELETTLISVKEEITNRELELVHLKDVLNRTMKERDEAQARCQKLMLENLLLQQQLQQKEQQQQEITSLSGVSSNDDESKPAGDSNKHIASPESNRSTISSPGPVELQPESSLSHEALKLAADRPLPKKGKLLQAVKDAGPLLQNLLLAGPLPQWQHPPPQLTSIDIPPVLPISPTTKPLVNHDSFNNLNGCLTKKRSPTENYEGSDSSPNTRHQKVVLH